MSKNFISLNNISYALPNGDVLFSGVSATFRPSFKTGVVGDNGVGKSTLLDLVAQKKEVAQGAIQRQASYFLLPQDIHAIKGNILQVLGIDDEYDYEMLAMFSDFSLNFSLSHDFASLSGGEKQKILIIKAFLSGADILFFDEPTNNLDAAARVVFYNLIKNSRQGMVVVSHDRALLNEMDEILELTASGLKNYGGNYEFFKAEKDSERERLLEKESELAREVRRLKETRTKNDEQMQHSEKYGKKMIATNKRPPIAAKSLKGAAVISNAKKQQLIDEKIEQTSGKLYDVGLALRDERIKIPAMQKPFIKDVLLEFKNVSFAYDEIEIVSDFSFAISGKERVWLKGSNGAGKTTLLKLAVGLIQPTAGKIDLNGSAVYLDQTLSLLKRDETLLDNISDYAGLNINEAHAILASFKFRNEAAKKRVAVLSGGELLRATLAAVLGSNSQPHLIILDEPTNNLDIKSVEVLEDALRQYMGALLVVTHDKNFAENIGITRILAC